MTTTPAATFRRLPDPAPGLRAYSVTVDGTAVGTVTNRQGGWWRAVTTDGAYAGSFHSTRKSAADALIGASIPAPPTVDAPAPERPILDAALVTLGVRSIATERLVLDAAVRAMRLHPSARTERLGGMVAHLSALAGIDEELIVELVGEAYVDLIES